MSSKENQSANSQYQTLIFVSFAVLKQNTRKIPLLKKDMVISKVLDSYAINVFTKYIYKGSHGIGMGKLIDLTGQRFGKLLVIRKEPADSDSATKWRCCCDCGNECVKRSSSLRSGNALDCGCESSSLIDLSGQTFGKITVVEKMPPEADRRTRWRCRCECGNMCIVLSRALRKGLQKSCGCGRRKDLAGKRFGNLTAIERSDKYIEVDGRGKKYLWKCVCDCGEIVYRLPEKLRDNTNSACEHCIDQRKVAAMVQNAGFVEGTQLNKIASTKALKTSKSGIRGVFFNNRTGKWRAMLKFQGISHYLGEYKDIADAIKARKRAEEEYFSPVLERYGIS